MMSDLFEELEQGKKLYHGFYKLDNCLIHLNIVEKSSIEIPWEILSKVYEEMRIPIIMEDKNV